LKLGNFLKNKNNSIKNNQDLRGKLLTKFGRYGSGTTKIKKKTLQIAKRLKQINESNEKIGKIVENNTEIGVNNLKNNNTLPTRAQLLYYIIFYILKMIKLNKPSPSAPSAPSTAEGPVPENNWEFDFNSHVANLMNVLERVKKQNVGVNSLKKLMGQMAFRNNNSQMNATYQQIRTKFNKLGNKEKSELPEYINYLISQINSKREGSTHTYGISANKIKGYLQNLKRESIRVGKRPENNNTQ